MLKRIASHFSPGVRKAAHNTGWLLLDRIFRMGVAVVVSVAVARYLGPDLFGQLNFAFAFVTIFMAIATLGLDNLVVRFLVHDPGTSGKILGTASALRLAGTAVCCAVVIALGYKLRPGQKVTEWLIVLIALSLFPQVLNTIELYFQAHVASKYTVWGKTVAFTAVAGWRLLLIRDRAPLVMFAWAILVENLLGGVALIVAYWLKRYEKLPWTFDGTLAKKMLHESWPLILSSMAIMVYMRLDQVMLGQMAGDHAVGIYSAAVRLSEVWYFIPTIVVNTVFPTIVRSKAISEKLYMDRIEMLFEVMVLSAYVVAIPLTLLSHQVTGILLGKQYIEAANILSLHIWTGLFVFIGVAQSPWIISEKLTKFSFITTAAGALVNGLLNLVLIPRLGPMGAAISTVAAQIMASYLSNAFYAKTRPIFALQTRAFFLPSLARLAFGRSNA